MIANRNQVAVNFVFFKTEASLFVVLLLAIALGFVAGWLFDDIRERRRRRLDDRRGRGVASPLQEGGEERDALGDPLGRLVAEGEARRRATRRGIREEVRAAHECDTGLGRPGQQRCRVDVPPGRSSQRKYPPSGELQVVPAGISLASAASMASLRRLEQPTHAIEVRLEARRDA